MKKTNFPPVFVSVLVVFFAATIAYLPAEGSFEPIGFRLHDRAAIIELEEGTRRVRVLVQDSATSGWRVETVAHLDGRAGHIKIRLPDGIDFARIRCEASDSDPFPYSFYQGDTSFAQSADESNENQNRGLVNGDGALGGAPESGAVTVEESDIWKWRGRTLYFFNSYRGLQVFDLSNISEPRRTASLRMPAVGEQMYLIGDEHVALLANSANYWWYGSTSGLSSEILLVHHQGESLTISERIEVEGSFVESRLVGDRLYAVTRIWEHYLDEAAERWRTRSGLKVYALDLSDPANPVQLPTLDLLSEDETSYWYNAVVTATPEHLFVIPSFYDADSRRWYSEVNVIPISDPGAGGLKVAQVVPLGGRLNDKFKLRSAGGVLTTVSQVAGSGVEPYTAVETFALAAGTAGRPQRLDSVALAPGETVRATRFDGDRVYVVTFRQIDPLFIVDLSDPRDLRVLAELEIPGWSTYLEPLGDRLLSVGVEDRRVAISLFDVADPASLSMLERVYLGEEGRYSWTEANYNEKAVGWFPGDSLLVLPFSGYVDGEYRAQMQIIDVGEDTLSKRGVIDLEFNGRRSRLFEDDTLVAISGRDLRLLDIADRDEPQALQTLEISWPVERTLLLGEHLAQFESGSYSWWQRDGAITVPAKMRITTSDTLDVPVAELAIGSGGQIIGATSIDDRVYVLTNRTEVREIFDPGTERTNWYYDAVVTTHVIGVTNPAAPELLGSAEAVLEERWIYGQYEGQFLPGGELLWTPTTQSNSNPWWRCLACDLGGGLFGGDIAFPYYGDDSRHVLVVDVSDAEEPEVITHLDLRPPDPKRGYSESGPVFVRESLLTFGYRESEWSDGKYESRSFVQEFDLRDPAKPLRGEPVATPGLLQHLFETAGGGTVLFTTRQKLEDDEEGRTRWTSTVVIEASAFDGLQAFLLDGIEVEDGFYTPLAGDGAFLFKPMGNSWFYEEGQEHGLLVFGWNASEGTIDRLPSIALETSPSSLQTIDGLLFAFRTGGVDVIATESLPDARVASFDAAVFSFYFWSSPAIEVASNPSRALVAVGTYGVEELDLRPLADAPLAKAEAGIAGGARSKDDGEWITLGISAGALARASGSDFVGSLAGGYAWRFQPTGAGQSYLTWAGGYFNPEGLPGFEPPAPEADSDGDGSSDIVEFVLGTRPDDPTSWTQPLAEFVRRDDETFLALSFAPDPSALGATTLTELSDDLHHWREASEGADVQTVADGAFIRVVVLRDIASEGRGFVRLRFAEGAAD